MKALKIILIILGAIIVLLFAVYALNGGFKKIKIRIEEQGGEIMVYENVIGDYMQTPVITEKIYKLLLNDEKIETKKGIGIFYDNPATVEKEKLRSEVGCIVENVDSLTLAMLSEKFLVKTIPVKEYIVTEFPMKGVASIMIGIMRVYPALHQYGEKHGYCPSAIIEIYDNEAKETTFRQEIVTGNDCCE
jgi:DNA gyrase inhibitor GyrI